MRGLLLVLSVLLARTAGAAEPDLATPRRALRFFVDSARAHDYAAASQALDLRDLPQDQWADKGPQLARELELVIGQERRFDWDKVSEQPEGDSTDGPGIDVIGTIPLSGNSNLTVRLVRSPDGAWRFGRSVVAMIPHIYELYGPGWLGEHVPAVLNDFGFLDLAAWQWLGLLFGLALALFVSLVLGTVARRIALRVAPRKRRAVERQRRRVCRALASRGLDAALQGDV